ncbi:MAG: D-glucuronyl C5-epimerase [Gammaproteobacteria bacterium]|nr:D-glucuronyl C5-epimerase [Gammaproteobacteria bacterium]
MGDEMGFSKIFSKVYKDIRSYLIGNEEFGFCELSLSSTAYPIDFTFALDREEEFFSPKDENGLPVRKYLSAGVQYNPTRMASYALAHYNRYLETNNEEHRRIFMKVADWFMGSRDGVWSYEFDWGELKAPWISAMAQGEGVSVLVRAWHLSGEERYIEQALRAIEPFSKEISDGGVVAYLEDGDPFLEEYPTSNPSHVLNGFLFAVIGLVDIERIAGQELPEGLGADGWIGVLERHIQKWDLGFWSAYDLTWIGRRMRNPATMSYHRLHISQLKYLVQLYNAQTIFEILEKWELYMYSLFNRLRALVLKINYRMRERAQR